MISQALDLEPRTGCQMQLIPELLGNDDPASFVDLNNGIHNSILPSKMAF